MLYIAISGMVILVIFALYYHWWMQPVSEFMRIYWDKDAMEKNIILRIVKIFSAINSGGGVFVWGFVPFALLGIYSLCKSKNKIACSLALSLAFVFLASSIGMWPLNGRLWLFLPVIVFIFTPIGTDIALNKTKNKKVMSAIGFSFLLVLTSFLSVNCLMYAKHKAYFRKEEINPLISYVQENIKDDEKLYLYRMSIKAFRYKNGYNATKIGNAADSNIIYGKNREEWNTDVLGNEVQSILENKKNYLLFSHHIKGIEGGLFVLRKYGTLTEVMNVYDTPLYYFERNTD